MQPRLPTFLINGVSRSGTTSLFRYLSEHPDVGVASHKEVNFFSVHFDKGVGWYADHFANVGSVKHVGEATPGYFHRAEVPPRVATTLPGAFLITSFRHPVDRIHSQYWLHRERGANGVSFETTIDRELVEGQGRYIDQSRYAEHLENWDFYFSRSKQHFIFFEELAEDPVNVFLATCRFLEIDEIVPPVVGKVINEYREIRSQKLRTLAKRLPKRIQNAVALVNSTSSEYPRMSSQTRRRMLAYFEPCNHQLASRLGRPVPESWSS